jgi:hypothetical protein
MSDYTKINDEIDARKTSFKKRNMKISEVLK